MNCFNKGVVIANYCTERVGLGDEYFESQQVLNDRANFFTDTTLPDAVISDNNLAGYLLFGGSDQLINEMIDSQWQQK